MNEFLYMLKPVRLGMVTDAPTDAEGEVLAAHLQYLQELLGSGQAVMFGRTTNEDISTFGIVVFEADDEAAALQIMNNDPAVKGGIMTADLFPYRIAGLRGQ